LSFNHIFICFAVACTAVVIGQQTFAKIPNHFNDDDQLKVAQIKTNSIEDGNEHEEWKFVWSGLADFRYAQTDRERSFLSPDSSGFGGLNPLRYGGRDKNSDGKGDIHGNAFHLSNLDLVLDLLRDKKSFGHIQIHHDDTSYTSGTGNKLGIFEAFLQSDLLKKEKWKLNLKAGIFIPHLSFENESLGWSTSKTISPSVINSWFGEELRLRGAQLALSRQYDFGSINAAIGGFSGNDGLGSALAWRGWSMHDSYSYYGRPLRLRQQSLITSGTVDPFVETDDKLGYFARVGLLWQKTLKFSYTYLDNNGDKTIRDTVTRNWAWDTSFHHFGLSFFKFSNYEFMAQAIKGNGKAGRAPEVNIDFESFYLLLNRQWSKLEASVRFEQFAVLDKDDKADKNYQRGKAWTYAIQWNFDQRQLLMLEAVSMWANRPGMESYSQSSEELSSLYQLNYRCYF